MAGVFLYTYVTNPKLNEIASFKTLDNIHLKLKQITTKMNIFFAQTIFPLQVQGNVLKTPCLLEIDIFFSTNSSMNAVNFIGRDIKNNSNMHHHTLKHKKLTFQKKKKEANE